MKLSISNIGWDWEKDETMYQILKKKRFPGLEIAPTRMFPNHPYDKLTEASVWAKNLKRNYNLEISSMQSIWFGRQEKIFGSKEEREVLLDYTKRAIDFGESIGCRNLVFGCPRNRNVPEKADFSIGVAFFKELGDYAAEHNTVIGMEANPPIYNTNYINDTLSAIDLIEKVDSKGFKLNLDLGTMIWNKEHVGELAGKVSRINHVHISEPGLKPIKRRKIHQELKDILEKEGYQGFVSIEMGKTGNLWDIEDIMAYIEGIFRG